MRNMRVKLFVAGVLLVIAVGYLGFAGLKDGWVYHVDVDQYVNNPEMKSQRVRLVGKVSPQGLEASPGKFSARFNLTGKGASQAVAYRGVIPDQFKADGEVVVEGKLDGSGIFQADVLMTKCASKYQSEEHARRNKESAQ